VDVKASRSDVNEPSFASAQSTVEIVGSTDTAALGILVFPSAL
jgi:hypothetical protein